jgi:hypothetical protein
MTELQTYDKAKPPDPEKLRKTILVILGRTVNGELPIIRATDLRKRVCGRVKAPSFYAFLKELEEDQLVMVSGVDHTWAQCALWDHPRMVEWRIERAKWQEQWDEMKRRDELERRKREIENAPRLARERFQKELGEFFVDNSDALLKSVKNLLVAHQPKHRPWLLSGVKSFCRERQFKFAA